MIRVKLSNKSADEGIVLDLPATPAEVSEAFLWFERIGIDPCKVRIAGVTASISNLGPYILRADIHNPTDMKMLNELAERIEQITGREQDIFAGVLGAEGVHGLNDVLALSKHLDDYVILPNIGSKAELGRFLVERGYKDFPEPTVPYLDYAKIGAEYHTERGGIYAPAGYVLRKELYHEQAVGTVPMIRLWFRTMTGPDMILNLPATEEQLESAKRALNVEEFASAQISKAEMHHYMVEHIPMDAICVEDANILAIALEEMTEADDESLSKFLAVLTVEQPDTFPAALRLALDLEDYALVPDEDYEYGEFALKRICTDQEVLDAIDGYMDYEAFGIDHKKQDGVRETEYGAVVRLTSPFPAPEQGQQML